MLISASALGALIYLAKTGALMLLRSPTVQNYVLSKFKRKPKPMKPVPEYLAIVEAECKALGVESDLMSAIISLESGWRPNETKYEPNYKYLWHTEHYAEAENNTVEVETVLQKTSLGLCQIMGANARWLSYEAPLMTLLDPAINIKMGVKYFAQRCNHYGSIQDKIAAYNAGTPRKKDGEYVNQLYVDRVLGYYSDLKKSKT